jgi:DNA-binding response OmpR family regulator
MNDVMLPLSTLLVGEFLQDRLLLYEVFRRYRWRLFEARDRHRAMDCLGKNPAHVVIAETDTQGWNWKQILQDLRGFSPPPQLIVASRTADDHLWAEVLNVGGYDVLPQPFERDELERVVASAFRHFNPQPQRTGRLIAGAA